MTGSGSRRTRKAAVRAAPLLLALATTGIVIGVAEPASRRVGRLVGPS